MRNPFRLRPPPLTAAASVAPADRVLERGSVIAREINEAWNVWREVGEIHYATVQQARLISRVKWDIFIDGEQVPPDTAEEMLRTAFTKGPEDLNRQAAIHLQVAGGYYLSRVRGMWHVLPAPADHKAKVLIADSDINILNRTPDPRDNDRTDSPVLAAIDPARELILVRAQARAAARNRTAQLNTVIYPLEGAGPNPDEFEKKFTRVMTTPLENEQSASVVVPNLVGFQGDWIDKWKTMDLSGPVDKNLHEKIPQLVKQIAVILDAPPQILLGMSDLNHWAAWAVQEDNWFGHVEPLAKTVADGLELAIAEAADLDPDRIEIKPDPAPLLQRRPSLDNILSAHEQGVVNDQFVRKHLGADDDDAPEQTEENSGSGDDDEDGEPDTEQDDDSDQQPVNAAAPAIDARRLAEIDSQAYDSVEDVILDTTERALERLGAKVRSISQGRDIGVQGAGALSNADLAIRFDGEIPNRDSVIEQVVNASVSRLNRVVDRAYSRLRDAGLDIKADDMDIANAQDLYRRVTAMNVVLTLDEKPDVLWESARRVIAVAGGSEDLAIVSAPTQITGTGIALGPKSLAAVKDQYSLVPGSFIWLHQTRTDREHPVHAEFNGDRFNGRFILKDGVNWFPGDHDGCRCIAMPDLVRVG